MLLIPTFNFKIFFQIFLIILLWKNQFTNGLNIVHPPSLSKYVNSPTISKFFGPQYYPHTNYTAIYFTGDVCLKIRNSNKVGGIEIGNFTGYVVIVNSFSGCTEDVAYKNVDETEAAGVIIAGTLPVPGLGHYLSIGDRQETTSRKTPLLQTNRDHLIDVINYMNKPDYSLDVIIEIYLPDENYWLDIFDSFHFFMIIRVFLPLFFFSTSAFAFYLLYENLRAKKSTMTNTKTVVFALEGLIMFFDGFFLASNGIAASDFLPREVVWFFYNGFAGTEMFTTVIVAMFYQSLNHANKTRTEVVDIFLIRKKLMAISFVTFLFVDLVPGILSLFGANAMLIIIITSLCVSVINFAVAAYLIRVKIKFFLNSKSTAQKFVGSSSSKALIAISKHTERWLLFGTFFMSICILASICMVFPFFITPTGLYPVMLFTYIGRWGTVYVQLMALKYKYQLRDAKLNAVRLPTTKPNANTKKTTPNLPRAFPIFTDNPNTLTLSAKTSNGAVTTANFESQSIKIEKI
eukprot:c21890_g1_i1.p1 GENE.c21890_g1_i1~~c21890_g1_i1.p1  ORF type:complete len:518 (+),score=128.32 c21890_g1_i1:2-1555(+)